MNLVDRLSYYPDISEKVLFKKFSSQETLLTQRYDSSGIKIENQFTRKPLDDDKKLGDERIGKITDPYRGPELPASAPETSRTNIGKVRQLFEERRKQIRRTLPTALVTSRVSAIGRDKSYPLQPIRRPKPETRDENSIEKESEITQPIIYDCSIFGKLPNLGGRLLSERKNVESDAMKSNFSRGTETSASTQKSVNSSVNKITEGVSRIGIRTSNGLKKPPNRQQPTPQQRNAQPIKKPIRTTNVSHVNDMGKNVNINSNNVNDEKKNTNNTQNDRKNTNNSNQSSPTKSLINKKPMMNGTRPATTKNKTLPIKTTPPPGMSNCKICGRNFATERIKLHQEICEKSSKKKRKVFDPVKHRLKGTEAEGMIKQIKTAIKAPPPAKKGNWRKQHEEFINNIRAARMVKQHVAKGGKVSDLPVPPPLDTSDYVQCPHCGRKFNEAAAERHIPKCATMKHNKPKNNVPAAKPDPSKQSRNRIITTKKR